MERRRIWWSSLLVLLLVFSCEILALCDSLEEEGRALLRFREEVEFDPFGALSNWGRPGVDHCFWFGVDCSEDGRVLSLILRDLCLQGRLTSEIRKLVNLKSLILHNNLFSGTIPEAITELSELEVLDLGQNNFSRLLPRVLLRVSSLKVLVLGNNMFTIPKELKELDILSEFQVDEDMLCSSRGSLRRNFKSAAIRRLLQENITHRSKHPLHERRRHARDAEIAPSPSPIHSPSPSPLPFQSPSQSPSPSPNYSPSPSPTISLLRSQSPLLSPAVQSHSPIVSPSPPPSLDKPQSSSAPAPTQSVHTSTKNYNSESVPAKSAEKQKKTRWEIYASVGAGVFLLSASFLIYYLCSRKAKVGSVMPWKTGLSGQLQKALVTGVPSLNRSELETACEDFSNIIDTLTGCSFYKGTLSSGVEIAVTSSLIKSAKDWSDQSEVLFREKISVLSRVNHKNFMNLIGYCKEEEPFTRMLVFEYSPNGTLFEHLHIKEAEPLDWTARLRVAMGIAYCLEHMHKLNPPMILRNLNSSTVYLTEDQAAKISDLSFWNDENETGLSYEVLDNFEPPLSNQEDIVYKFGILLLELISGRLPFSKDDGLLVLWASSYLTGKRPLNGIVDPTLQLVREADIIAFCDVIRLCINHVPKERPTMADVVARLRVMTSMTPEAVSPKLSPLWWAELEIISS
ncbi:inactive receptor-like serine/threonine-protein kinase At2g40270 [Phalaenopsis equestris]|uniref:inactive receptor-like serine/threonine-protein kinase At2g40270 n=1 Tax=Phalaenopsis equestris TaxID=78828 RepID=UPI0009E45DC0|nr:inactive receptor-like serine/threonine-protein kinase At2g40270 [Phalaenopsis equestris]